MGISDFCGYCYQVWYRAIHHDFSTCNFSAKLDLVFRQSSAGRSELCCNLHLHPESCPIQNNSIEIDRSKELVIEVIGGLEETEKRCGVETELYAKIGKLLPPCAAESACSALLLVVRSQGAKEPTRRWYH